MDETRAPRDSNLKIETKRKRERAREIYVGQLGAPLSLVSETRVEGHVSPGTISRVGVVRVARTPRSPG